MKASITIKFSDEEDYQYVKGWLNSIHCDFANNDKISTVFLNKDFDESLFYQFLESCE